MKRVAVGNGVSGPEAKIKESLQARFWRAAGVRRRGMHEEKHTRTWETLSVPDSKGWNEVPVSLGRKNGIRRSSNSKIPALKVKVPPFYEPEMEHKHQRRTAQGKISGKLVQR